MDDAGTAKKKAQAQNPAKTQDAKQKFTTDKLPQDELKKPAEESAKQASEKNIQNALPKSQGVGM